jgi:hypothetical protein
MFSEEIGISNPPPFKKMASAGSVGFRISLYAPAHRFSKRMVSIKFEKFCRNRGVEFCKKINPQD